MHNFIVLKSAYHTIYTYYCWILEYRWSSHNVENETNKIPKSSYATHYDYSIIMTCIV